MKGGRLLNNERKNKKSTNNQSLSDPLNLNYVYNLGVSMANSNQFEEARKYFLQVLKLDRNHIYALNNLGVVEEKLGNITEAIQYLNQAIEADPKDTVSLLNLGNLFYTLGKYNEAQELFESVLDIDQKCLPALIQMGLIRVILGDESGAIRIFAEANRLYPDNVLVRNLLDETIQQYNNQE